MTGGACSDFISFDFLKATPHEIGGERFVFLEASNEGVDQQGERVLSKALAESAEFYKKFGNVDLDHMTILGKRQGSGIDHPEHYEIGMPTDVVINDKTTFVKAQLYKGDTALAANANMVWASLTELSPPARWYPSVGGSVLAKSTRIDPETKNPVTCVEKVRWSNVALSRTPVNQHIPSVSTAPIGVFAKSLNAFVLKGLEAGHVTDSALLTGGGALRAQSLDGTVYQFLRDQLAGLLRSRDKTLPTKRDPASLARYVSTAFGLDESDAVEMVKRFFSDLSKRRGS